VGATRGLLCLDGEDNAPTRIPEWEIQLRKAGTNIIFRFNEPKLISSPLILILIPKALKPAFLHSLIIILHVFMMHFRSFLEIKVDFIALVVFQYAEAQFDSTFLRYSTYIDSV
jgi:hypothetical protein